MNHPINGPYRLLVEAIPGEVIAKRGDVVLARSKHAKMMHETRIPPTIYFPAVDVASLGQKPSARRTFCPFKGTAVYHDVLVHSHLISNGAWTYPHALPESRDIEGYVGFMPSIVDRFESSEPIPERTIDGHISSPIVDWLFREAWAISSIEELTLQLANLFVIEGVAVSRLNATIWSLHPQIAGRTHVWNRKDNQVKCVSSSHENLARPQFQNSPIRYVTEGLGGVRQPLTDDEAEFSFPIMEELKAEGATDYVAMPLPFSDGQINVLTMATDHPNGFTTANLGLVFECSAIISRLYEVHSHRANAQNLLGTFLGKETGARVLGGEIKRGDGDEIEAAILFCDLRGSSRLSEIMPRQDYLDALNAFFETVGNNVDEHNGEILKFIGDGVLAVFSAKQGAEAACENAVRAAEAIERQVRDLEIDTPNEQLNCSLGACFGTVTYGNVGSSNRLDFTVIGNAANVAARLSDLGKTLDSSILLSGKISSKINKEFRLLGEHQLRNISAPVEVFTV